MGCLSLTHSLLTLASLPLSRLRNTPSSSPLNMPPEAACLICSVPIHNSNLGIDSCRACAVFYRRHLNDNELRCRKGTNDCMEKNVRPFCRKCRFMKFAAVLDENMPNHHQTIVSADSEDAASSSSSSDDNGVLQAEDESQAFIDHRSFNLFSTVHEKSPMFDRMKKAYSMLCFVRNCGEQGILDKDVSSALQGDGQVFYPVNYGAKLSSLAILKGGLLQFCESVFDEFTLLPQDHKNIVIEKSALIIQSLDGITPTYTFYVNSGIIEDFEDGFATNNVPEIIREMKDNFYLFLDNIRVSFERIQPTNEEFLAMLGLTLWNSESTEQSEKIVCKNRSSILSELHKFYATRGIVDYSARLGEIFCLLESIENAVESAEEGISMINLMNSINLHD